jgi:hypothetical protein
MMPLGGGAASLSGAGSTVVRIHLSPNLAGSSPSARAQLSSTTAGQLSGAAVPGSLAALAQPPAQPTTAPNSLTINLSGPTPVSQTIALGPNSSGCSGSSGGTVCQLTLALAAGTYTGTVATYASSNASSASALAPPAAIAFSVAAAGSNVVNLSVGAVPAQLIVVPASFMSAENAQGGIDLLGAGKHPLLVEMLDPNQNVIVGTGPATFTISVAGGSLPVTVTQSATLAPNLFYVSAPASATTSTAALRVTVSYLGSVNPCTQSSAVCGGTTRIDLRQILAVANSSTNTVTLYTNGQSAPLTTIQNNVADPQALIFDALGDLFVANQPGSVSEFAPPYNGAATTITSSVNHPQALALDVHGNLFVANGSGSNTITLYSPPYTGSPSAAITSGVNDPTSLALDTNADLFVANTAANTVTEYAPPYNRAVATISKGLNSPNSLALDAHGNLFVTNLNSTPNSVVEYAPPFSNASMPVVTITNGVNEQGAIGLSGSATLFVPNEGANTVTEYVAPYTGTPTTIVGGQSQPVALAIDALNDLFVANYGNNTVTEYPPPYAGGSWTTISSGIGAPQALALSPATGVGSAVLP